MAKLEFGGNGYGYILANYFIPNNGALGVFEIYEAEDIPKRVWHGRVHMPKTPSLSIRRQAKGDKK